MYKMAPVKLSILKTLRLLLRPGATPDSLEKTVPETTKRSVRQNYSHYTRDTLCSLAFLTGSTYSWHYSLRRECCYARAHRGCCNETVSGVSRIGEASLMRRLKLYIGRY